MSSFNPPYSLIVPLQARRNNPSTSSSTELGSYVRCLVPCTSPLLSSSPSLAPLLLTRQHECPEWQTVQDTCYPWSRCTRPEHSLPYEDRPLPSLMTKFAAHTLPTDTMPSYGPSPFSYVTQTLFVDPHGDSAISESEDCDLESMDIHIRQTYFATSSERGRWLSSPIPPRVQSQATLMRGHSSPVKPLSDASPLGERARRHKIKRSVDRQMLRSSPQDRNQDLPCSSPLPPSSPLTSPILGPTFLSGDWESDFIVEPGSNSDECRSLMQTPELSISPTPCTSPIESMRTSSPHVESAATSAHQPTDISYRPTGSNLSRRHTSPCSPKRITFDIYTTNFDPDDILSPLSQFELELPETEPPKHPLSGTVHKHPTSLVVAADPVRTEDGSATQAVTYEREDAIDGPGSDKIITKRRVFITSAADARRSTKRITVRSGGPPSDPKQEGWTDSSLSNHSEPPSKKSKLSHCGNDLESRVVEPISTRGGTFKAKRLLRSPSRRTAESHNSEPACLCGRKRSKSSGRTRIRQWTPSPPITPVSIDAVAVEFRASLTGMLIEAFATSRATSMDASALYLLLTRAHPHLAERSKGQFLMDIAMVLEAARARCGMFEKVDGSGETRHKALESRWFYVPEKDEDPERASLMSGIMPRRKRNETKKYKQYYYRPLDKISRWDPEDAP